MLSEGFSPHPIPFYSYGYIYLAPSDILRRDSTSNGEAYIAIILPGTSSCSTGTSEKSYGSYGTKLGVRTGTLIARLSRAIDWLTWAGGFHTAISLAPVFFLSSHTGHSHLP